MIIAFPLDHAQRFLVLGRDDATLLYQSGLRVGIVAIGADNRPYSTEVPIYRLQLAFGKRAGAGQSARLAPSPRGEDDEKLTAFFGPDMTPCA